MLIGAEEKPYARGIMRYINVNDRLDQVIAANGGKIVQAKHPIGPFGFRTIIIDSDGNRVALHSE